MERDGNQKRRKVDAQTFTPSFNSNSIPPSNVDGSQSQSTASLQQETGNSLSTTDGWKRNFESATAFAPEMHTTFQPQSSHDQSLQQNQNEILALQQQLRQLQEQAALAGLDIDSSTSNHSSFGQMNNYQPMHTSASATTMPQFHSHIDSMNQSQFMMSQQQFPAPSAVAHSALPVSAPGNMVHNSLEFGTSIPHNMLINTQNSIDNLGNVNDNLALRKGSAEVPIEASFECSSFPEPVARVPPALPARGRCLHVSFDNQNLSEYQILVRKSIEFFVVQKDDVHLHNKGRNKQVVLGQVGIRCRFCSQKNAAQTRLVKGATYYPSKLSGIYQAAQSLASTHLCGVCENIPVKVRKQLLLLRERKSAAGGGKQYWSDSAYVLGVRDNAKGGLKFEDDRKSPANQGRTLQSQFWS